VLLIPQLAVAVAIKMLKFKMLLWMAPEKREMSQFFIIRPDSPVKGMASPSPELVAIAF
jgi:hypothetical protein